MKYDYIEAMEKDIDNYLSDVFPWNQLEVCMYYDDFRTELTNMLCSDMSLYLKLTGYNENSYTHSNALAEEYLKENQGLLSDLVSNGAIKYDDVINAKANNEYEKLDSLVRQSLFSQTLFRYADDRSVDLVNAYCVVSPGLSAEVRDITEGIIYGDGPICINFYNYTIKNGLDNSKNFVEFKDSLIESLYLTLLNSNELSDFINDTNVPVPYRICKADYSVRDLLLYANISDVVENNKQIYKSYCIACPKNNDAVNNKVYELEKSDF